MLIERAAAENRGYISYGSKYLFSMDAALEDSSNTYARPYVTRDSGVYVWWNLAFDP